MVVVGPAAPLVPEGSFRVLVQDVVDLRGEVSNAGGGPGHTVGQCGQGRGLRQVQDLIGLDLPGIGIGRALHHGIEFICRVRRHVSMVGSGGQMAGR